MRHYKLNRKKRNFRKRNFNVSFLKTRFFWFFGLGIILISGLTYLFIFSDVFKIKEIKVLSSSEYLKASVEEIINQELNKNIFLLKTKEINTKVLDQFPEILELDFKKEMPDTLTIQVEGKKEIAVLCYENYDKCLFIDENGLMFKQIEKELINENELIIFLTELDESFTLKETFSLSNKIEDFLEIERMLENNFKIEIKNFIIISEKRLNVEIEEGWEVYFSLEKDIKLQTTKLRILLEKEIPMEERKNLEYIDLRFERVFYK